MVDKEALQLELADVYAELSDIAAEQRALNRRRDEAEGNRNAILIELGRISLGTNHDITAS